MSQLLNVILLPCLWCLNVGILSLFCGFTDMQKALKSDYIKSVIFNTGGETSLSTIDTTINFMNSCGNRKLNNMFYAVSCLLIVSLFKSGDTSIATRLQEYFQSDNVHALANEWENYKKAYESSISSILTHTYGREYVNVLSQNLKTYPAGVSSGIYFSENTIDDAIFKNLRLDEFPKTKTTFVNFDLAAHSMFIEIVLERLIVQAEYTLFNSTNSINKVNPSLFQSEVVTLEGSLAIAASNCKLAGNVLVVMHGPMVMLRYNNIKLSSCDFEVEVSNFDLPPAIRPFFTNEQREILEQVIGVPLKTELLTQLQGAIYSTVDVENTFAKSAETFRAMQQQIFKQTNSYIDIIINAVNNGILSEQTNINNLPPFDRTLTFYAEYEKHCMNVKISGELTGLETLHPYNTGGPYSYKGSINIGDKIGFSLIQIFGKLEIDNKNSETKETKNFGIELIDTTVNVNFPVNNTNTVEAYFNGWRSIETSIHNEEFDKKNKMIKILLYGYMFNTVHKVVTTYVINNIKKARTNQAASNSLDYSMESIESSNIASPQAEDNMKDKDKNDYVEPPTEVTYNDNKNNNESKYIKNKLRRRINKVIPLKDNTQYQLNVLVNSKIYKAK